MSSLKKFKPRYWRSLAELENTPAFREYVENEFAAPLEHAPPNSPERRRFLELMGASFALAGVTGCFPEDKLVPLSRRPEGLIPGVPRKFATAMDIAGNAVGLHVTSYDGRPIKVDGNPQHPESLGGAFTYHQGSVLGVYDPDRSDSVKHAGKHSSYQEFDTFAKEHFGNLRTKGGVGLVVLSERSSSPTLAWMQRQLLATMPQARWVTFEPTATGGARAGSVLAFGAPQRTQYAFQDAKVVVTLDADFMSPNFPGALLNARQFSRGRVPERQMNRLYAIESGYSHAGALADHRLPLRAELIKAVAAYLDAEVSAKVAALPEYGAAQTKPAAAFLSDASVQKFLGAVVKDLLANVGASIVVAGPEQPAEVHALAHRLNTLLGNVGKTVFFTDDFDQSEANDVDALKQLVAGLDGVDTLLILGGNPAYTAPSDVPFAASLSKVKTSIHLSLYEDETSALCTWHLPAAHYLESWGDVRSNSGLVSIQQPLIAPIYGGRSAIEVLALVLGEEKADGQALVRRASQGVLGADRMFRKVLNDGFVPGSGLPHTNSKLRPIAPLKFSERELGGLKLGNGQYEVVFVTDTKVHDGRFSNNGWLQELPGSFSKLGWDNAALLPMSVAEEIGLAADGNLVTLTINGRSVTLPGVVAPGQAEGSIRIALGYGRTHAGHVGGLASGGVASVGANAYSLRTSEAYATATGASLSHVGQGERLANSQDLYAIDQLGREGIEERVPELIRAATLAEYREKPHFAEEKVEHKPLLSLWVPPVSYEGHKWGMAVDLNKCIGCSSCVTACQAENNIPVVGRKPMSMGREMLWLRVDRYYTGEPATAEVAFQPMPCQQCENAPCEQVCPVGATMHSREGLNDMVYNRCIGTRYCSNNCPYKVRRFNYFNYNLDVIGITPYTPTTDPKMKVKSMVFNPEVTVRSRGVMEKCTFCVQRIQNAKIRAKNEKRPIPDGEIRTACQDTCPTEAIVFGDLNDSQSEVARQHNVPRAYELLGELNNRPRVRYLARVKNPNPELA